MPNDLAQSRYFDIGVAKLYFMNVVFIMQDLFFKGKQSRTISNKKYTVFNFAEKSVGLTATRSMDKVAIHSDS